MIRCTCPAGFVPRDLSELCPWCQRLRLGNARIEETLANLGADHRPRAGWDASVLAVASRRSARQHITVAIVCAVAIVALCALAWWQTAHRQRPLRLDIKVEYPVER